MDIFPRRLHINFPSGKDKYQTGCGVLFTVIFVVILILFTLMGFSEISDSSGKEAVFTLSE